MGKWVGGWVSACLVGKWVVELVGMWVVELVGMWLVRGWLGKCVCGG